MEDLTDGVQPREDKPRQDTHKAGELNSTVGRLRRRRLKARRNEVPLVPIALFYSLSTATTASATYYYCYPRKEKKKKISECSPLVARTCSLS